MHTTTGTLSARAMARCSLDMPIRPAFAPTIRMTHEGAPEVSPYKVVFRYRSCPARSKRSSVEGRYTERYDIFSPLKETIFAACVEIDSQERFSRCEVESADLAAGSMGSPEGAKPRIYY
jgi:hypothetical protein